MLKSWQNGVKMSAFNTKPRTFFQGFGVISKGLSLARKDKLVMLYSLVPILISIGFLYLGFEVGYAYLKNLMFSFTVDKWSFDFFGGLILLWLAKFFFKSLTVILVVIFSYIFLQVLYIPFYSFIAERVLKKEFGIELANESWSAFLLYTVQMIKTGVLKSIIFLLVAILCFALSFIPPLGFLPLYFGLLVIAYDAFDYSLEILSFKLRERLDFIKKETFLINGHTFALGLLSLIPGLMFLFLPFAVAGAALTIGEMYESAKQNS